MLRNASVLFVDSVNLTQQDANIPRQAASSPYSLYGYGAFPIGSAMHGCLCGWVLNSQKKCEVPWPSICNAIGRPLSQQSSGWSCSYDPLTPDGQDAEEKIVQAWQQEWPCPDTTEVSDGWGIVPVTDSEEWMKLPRASTTSLSASLAEVIYSGRAGLRIGNMQTLQEASRSVIKPVTRKQVKEAVQKRCVSSILKTFDPISLAKDVADDLIPVAQGVSTESWPVSVCLRFSIEYLRLRVLRMLESSAWLMEVRGSEITQAANLQQAVVQMWKHKCESQLGMVAVCQSNGIFDMIPELQKNYSCPFKISDLYSTRKYYVGPSSCLVYSNSAFYDPCLLPSNPCGTTVTTLSLADVLQEAARIKFDVRSLGNGEVLGTWPLKFTGSEASKNEVAAAASRLLEEWRTSKTMGLPWRLSKSFAEQIVEGGGTHANAKGSVGNTRLQWSTSEGFANVTTDFCDAIAGMYDFYCIMPTAFAVSLICLCVWQIGGLKLLQYL